MHSRHSRPVLLDVNVFGLYIHDDDGMLLFVSRSGEPGRWYDYDCEEKTLNECYYPGMQYPDVDGAGEIAIPSKVLLNDATIFAMEPSWLKVTWNKRREYSSDPCRWYT